MSGGCGRRRFDQFAQRVVARRFELGDDPLVHATVRGAIDRGRVDAIDGHALLTRERQGFVDATIMSRRDTDPAYAPAAQRFKNGIDAVNDHQVIDATGVAVSDLNACSAPLQRRPISAAKATARALQPRIGAMPALA